MTEFLVEMYVSPTDAGAVRHLEQCARVAAAELSEQEIPVRYVRSIFVPEEETCFIFHDAFSVHTARQAARLARLPFVCIAAALATERGGVLKRRRVLLVATVGVVAVLSVAWTAAAHARRKADLVESRLGNPPARMLAGGSFTVAALNLAAAGDVCRQRW